MSFWENHELFWFKVLHTSQECQGAYFMKASNLLLNYGKKNCVFEIRQFRTAVLSEKYVCAINKKPLLAIFNDCLRTPSVLGFIVEHTDFCSTCK